MAPDSTQPEPTETSPLLGKPSQNGQLVDPGDGIAPAGPEVYDDTDVEEDHDEQDLERLPSNGSAFKQQGLPEVRKRMKYIFPAIAIGVGSTMNIPRARAEISRCSFLLQTKHLSSRHMASLVQT